MNTIILINPPLPFQSYIKDDINKRAPLGLLSIGSVLSEAGYHVQIIDGAVDPNYLDKIIATKMRNVLLYGISCMTAQISAALHIAGIIREIAPEKPIVWGGVHPTLFPKLTCQSKAADVVVIGEGEYTLLEIANTFKNGSLLDTIKGIAYRSNGTIKINPIRDVTPLDELPFPNYDILPFDQYLFKNINAVGQKRIKKSMSIYAGAGCPFYCAFCINPIYAKKLQREKYRAKSPKRILDEVDHLINNHGVEDVYFQDELFFAKKSRLMCVVDGIIERGYKITWTANIHPSFISAKYLTEDEFDKISRSGCYRLIMGVESGSERVLKILRKRVNLNLVMRSAYLSKKYGITIGYSFMMGTPEETTGEVLETLEFIRKLTRINHHNYIIGPQLFRPYPGSNFYDIWKDMGGKEPKTIEDWARSAALDDSSYISVKDLPWIRPKDYGFFLIMNIIGSRYLVSLKNMTWDRMALLRMFNLLLFKLRLKLNFWRLPVEASLIQRFRILSRKL